MKFWDMLFSMRRDVVQSTHVVLFASLDGLQGLFCLIIYDSTYELSFDSIDASARVSY